MSNKCEKCSYFTYGRFLEKKTCTAAYYIRVSKFTLENRGCNCIHDPDLKEYFVEKNENYGREIKNYKYIVKEKSTNDN